MITAEEFLNIEFPDHTMFGEYTNNWTRHQVKRAMLLFARQCCLETAKNTRYKAIEVFNNTFSFMDTSDDLNFSACERDIMNIRNQDVLPNIE